MSSYNFDARVDLETSEADTDICPADEFTGVDYSSFTSSLMAKHIKQLCKLEEVSEPAIPEFIDLLNLNHAHDMPLSSSIAQLLNIFRSSGRDAPKVQRINLLDPTSDHYKIFMGIDYHHHGTVPLGPQHLSQIFPGFSAPNQFDLEVAAKVSQANNNRTTSIDTAYCAAITKAFQPKSLLIIGEDRGEFTDLIARQTPTDCIIFTLAHPPSKWGQGKTAYPTPISQSRNDFNEEEIGSCYTNHNSEHGLRIIPLIFDLLHNKADSWIRALISNFDLIIINGIQETERLKQTLLKATDILNDDGAILLNNFGQDAPLDAASIAAHIVHADRENNLNRLYQVKWKMSKEPSEQIETGVGILCR